MSATIKSPLGTRLDKYLWLRDAAPELLAAAKALLTHIAQHDVKTFCLPGTPGAYLRERALAAVSKAEHGYKFPVTYCSQCGGEFGPGDNGYSRCDEHAKAKSTIRVGTMKTSATDAAETPSAHEARTEGP